MSQDAREASRDAISLAFLAAACGIAVGAAAGGVSFLVRFYAKMGADVENPVELRRMADALERAYPPPVYGGPGGSRLPRPSLLKHVSASRNFVRPENCPEQTIPGPDLPDEECLETASARRCWNGVGESMWVRPTECINWYERNAPHDSEGRATGIEKPNSQGFSSTRLLEYLHNAAHYNEGDACSRFTGSEMDRMEQCR